MVREPVASGKGLNYFSQSHKHLAQKHVEQSDRSCYPKEAEQIEF